MPDLHAIRLLCVKKKTDVLSIESGLYEFYYSENLEICAGVDSLFKSGKGIYFFEDSCVYFKENFNWSSENGFLYMHYSDSKWINKCETEEEITGAYSQHWKVYKKDGNDFYATMEIQIIDGQVEYKPDYSKYYIFRKVGHLD